MNITAESVEVRTWLTSLVVATLFAMLATLCVGRWFNRLSAAGWIGVLFASCLVPQITLALALHAVVNWGAPSEGFGGIWVDPAWLPRYLPVIATLGAGGLVAFKKLVARRRLSSKGAAA